jgi:hypothetical protein
VKRHLLYLIAYGLVLSLFNALDTVGFSEQGGCGYRIQLIVRPGYGPVGLVAA